MVQTPTRLACHLEISLLSSLTSVDFSLLSLLLLFLHSSFSRTTPLLSHMPAALTNRQPSSAGPIKSVGSTQAAKSVISSSSTQESKELVVYNVVLEDDGSPAQAKTVSLRSSYHPHPVQPRFFGTPRQRGKKASFRKGFHFADRKSIDYDLLLTAPTTPSSFDPLRLENHDRCRNFCESKRNFTYEFPSRWSTFRTREVVSSKVSALQTIFHDRELKIERFCRLPQDFSKPFEIDLPVRFSSPPASNRTRTTWPDSPYRL